MRVRCFHFHPDLRDTGAISNWVPCSVKPCHNLMAKTLKTKELEKPASPYCCSWPGDYWYSSPSFTISRFFHQWRIFFAWFKLSAEVTQTLFPQMYEPLVALFFLSYSCWNFQFTLTVSYGSTKRCPGESSEFWTYRVAIVCFSW